MLKRLEVLGFKSFADKTAFEFGAGITCIVGPNGSGKSNVVDAIKWVMGEQSAKSLRGKEMADVIFNGSATRRSLGFAEATLVFDNSRRLLPVDADEVQLTRRVYRSGEGEYLINKNPSRLRDFRDLFMGTGAATEAYSVIEQGKVDVLLQSSTKDRRALFEEAAGISRFKARKLEALRKLEHVDQNLLRLNDIVEEVEKQLRGVKLQAARARRYQEHSDRLRELRLRVGLADFHGFTVQLEELDQKTEYLTKEASAHSSRCDSVDAKLIQVQSLAEDLDNQIRSLESGLTDSRQEIARLDSQVAYERAHARDLVGQIDRLRSQWAEFFSRVAELQKHIATIGAEVARVEGQCSVSGSDVEAEAEVVRGLRLEVDGHTEQVANAQARFMDSIQAANHVHNELAALDSQEKSLKSQRQRLASRCAGLAGPLEELAAQLTKLSQQESSAELGRDATRRELAELEERIEQLQTVQQETAEQLATLREDRSAVAARIDILDDLERRQEGVDRGVQQVLALPQFAGKVLGLVADLLPVEVVHAAWIDRALGERAQHVVIRRQSEAVELLAGLDTRLPGAVSFLALDCVATPAAPPNSMSQPGFIAFAEMLVKPAGEFRHLATHLLGRTIIVQDLQAALAMAKGAAPEHRFVTVAGDILESDGTIASGDPHTESGLVSRKSQLRALREDTLSLDSRIVEQERRTEELDLDLTRLEQDKESLEARLSSAGDEAAQLRNQLGQRRQRAANLEEELSLNRAEMESIDRDVAGLAEQRLMLGSRLAESEAEQRNIEAFIRDHEARIEERQAEVEERQSELTAAKIELAKSEGQLAGLRQRLAALTADLEDRQRVQRETREQIETAAGRERGCQRKILTASSQVSELYVRKEQLTRQIAGLTHRRDEFRSQRQTLSAESQASRERLLALQTELHQRELEASDQRHQRTTLVDRIREDYELELAKVYPQYQPDATLDREPIQQEIQELRRKLAGLGNVNLEALAELQELETRATTLHAQLDDLNQSKAALDEIIRKMNQDSQRLFMETLDTIRGHFGELFRNLFGGGRADIVLENEGDVLESGIEIVARPPGKELRSLSLLSGGEKTLTTVALLMAVFRSKPSPFCILDEVDAALDEANIERYTTLLREFASQAQFIMITHSRKSMVCADVLYGITMQESGVSKRVSVRFEDVNDQGEISEDALQRAETEALSEPTQPVPESGQEAA